MMGFFSFLFFIAAALGPSLYQDKLEKIQSFGEFNLSTLNGRKSLWYFFQPNCSSCRRQSTHFSCLPPTTEVLAIGVLGSRNQLSGEFKKYKLKGLALYGSKQLETKLAIKQTPTLLVVDEAGTVVKRFDSMVPCQRLSPFFK